MPTYEYACKDCGSHLEVVQSFSDDPLTECPHCSGPLRKVFGSIGITFKGSGFYKTDSRSGASAKRSSSGDGAKESTGDGAAKETKDTKETKETKAEPAKAASSSGSDSSGGTAKSA
jgi:putative FmdB family regulatory protein